MPALGDNARAVLERRYLLRDDRGALTEDPAGLFRRVAAGVAEAEPAAERARWAERFQARLSARSCSPTRRPS